jgi:ornithine cyclodeaminase
MLVLNAEQTRRCLPMELAIESQAAAFSEDVEVPLRRELAGSMYMPGRVGEHSGIKIVSTVPGNPSGLVLVMSPDGSPLGIVDGPTLTAVRTGAVAGLATRLLARADAAVLVVLGAGAMSFDQVEAVKAVRPIKRVLVWSRTFSRAQDLADRVGGEAVAEADPAVAEADVVSCATPATTPLFQPDSVRPGAHINAVGAFRPGMIEVPTEITVDAYVVVDDVEAAAAEAGDLIAAGRSPDATLTDVLAGRHAPIEADITLFKSVGVASQDVAAAAAALDEARRQGVGTQV